MTTTCLSEVGCLQLRWNQGEISAASIMSFIWIINESYSPGTRALTEPINKPPICPPSQTHAHRCKKKRNAFKTTHEHPSQKMDSANMAEANLTHLIYTEEYIQRKIYHLICTPRFSMSKTAQPLPSDQDQTCLCATLQYNIKLNVKSAKVPF